MKPIQLKQDVFDQLAVLAATQGFAHVIAFLCIRDNFITFREEMRADDMDHLYSPSRLIRTEMFTLIGLLMRSDPDFGLPAPANLATMVQRVDALFEELHQSVSRPWVDAVRKDLLGGEPAKPWQMGEAMREPIFYGGEGAFSFQTCDFAAQKYAADDAWLVANRGASISSMVAVAKAAGEFVTEKLTAAVNAGVHALACPSPLDVFCFAPAELAPKLDLSESTIEACVQAFALPKGHRNQTFNSLHDFNAVNASPIIEKGERRFLLFHFNALAEAVYESPFYWLCADKRYAPTALKHRGEFAEAFAQERFTTVFGPARVYRGVNIERSKGDRIGEIDVLAIFGDRAVVLQAKSKRLTLESRRGNDLQIVGDFKAAVQDAYNQAMNCAAALSDSTLCFSTSKGMKVELPSAFSQIFPVCLIADHYPALAFQTEQFLIRRDEPQVLAPLIIDVFALDVMTEMLHRPLRFLSYLEKRAVHGSKIHIKHEITLLSYHLKRNLWIDDEYDFVMLEDDIAADLEIAMSARRLGLPGKRTPEGILTAIEGSPLDAIIQSIEASPAGPMIDLVMLIYQLSGESLRELREGVDKVLENARQRGSSDFGLGFSTTGIAIHANFALRPEAEARLQWHMLLRKYRQRADSWYGLGLSPIDGSIRFGKQIIDTWKYDPDLEKAATQFLKTPVTTRATKRTPGALGRNDPCHCGSGKKYKKCHLITDTQV